MVIGCVVLATAQPMSTFASPAAEPPLKPDTIIYPKGSPAAPAAAPLSRPDSSYGSNLVLVVAVLLAGAGAWVLFKRRAGGGFLPGRAERKLQIEETRSLGNRQYLVVTEYEGKKFLLGVTPGQIQLLTPLEGGEEKK
jgi:flagellar protein FliO/FliZ